MRRHTVFSIACSVVLAMAHQYVAAQGFKFLEVTVLDPEGKPMADVPVDISLNGMAFPMPTNEKGVVAFNVPGDGSSRVQLSVKHEDYLAQGASWNQGEEVPEKFSIPMKKGVPIGGIVHDEEGKPIEGVKVEGIMVYQGTTDLPGGGKLQPYFYGEIATTDKEGRWKIGSAPEEKIELQLRFSHPDYASDRGYGFRGGTWEELKSLEKVVVMQQGIGVRGTIVDAEGKPVSGAKVGVGNDYVNNDMMTRTDDEGKYRISNMQPGSNYVTVYSPEHAPDLRQVVITKDMASVDFKLQPGKKMTFKLTDTDGQPIAGVGIGADTWRGIRSIMNLSNRGSTDANGVWVWEHAPGDAVQCDFYCRGYMSVRGQNFTARDEPYEVTMPRALKVEGTVVDAETGEPLKTFSAIQGIKWDSSNQPYYWERYNIQAGQDGKFTTEFDEPRQGHLVRIEAAGYRPGISRVINDSEKNVKLEFKLEKGKGPRGVVKLADGSPAANVEVLMAVANQQQLYISNGRYEQGRDNVTTKTDAEGRFELPFPEADFKLICLSDDGWGEFDGDVDADNLEMTLQPWARVEGVVMRGDKPLANEQIYLNSSEAYQQGRPQAYWSYQTKSDADGSFKFERLRSGTHSVSRQLKYGEMGGSWMNASDHATEVVAKPGETTKVQMGGAGRTIRGKLTIPEASENTVQWNMGAVQMYESSPAPAAKSIFESIGQAIARSASPKATPVKAQRRTMRSYGSTLDDGNFEFFDVQPGTYQITLQLFGVEGNQRNWNNVANFSKVVTVDEGAADEVIDLGEMEITMRNPQPTPTATLQLQAAPAVLPAE